MLGVRMWVTAALVVLVAAPSAAASVWETHGPWGGAIRSLVADPTQADVAYAVTDDATSFRTADAGRHWSRLPGDGVTALAIDPVDPTRLLRATTTGFFASVDAGASWTPLSSDSGSSDIAIAPSDHAVVYRAGPGSGSMQASADGGQTWRPMASQPPYVVDVAVDAGDPSRLYALQLGAGLWRSRNGGLSFRRLDSAFGGGTKAMAVDPGHPGTLFAATVDAVFRTTDGGDTWLRQGSLPAPATQLALDVHDSGRLLATTTTGVVASTDAGQTWSMPGTGVPVRDASSLVISPADSSRVYLGTPHGGIFVSGDGGRRWTARSEGIALISVGTIAVDPTQPRTLYAGTGARGALDSAGVFRSDDSGASWRPVNDGLGEPAIVAAAATSTPGLVYVAGASGAVYRSETGGATWQQTASPVGAFVRHLLVDPRLPATLYAATDVGVQVSQDGGDTWTIGIAAGASALTAETVAPWRVYASTDLGPARSDDHGDHWLFPGYGSTSRVTALAAHPTRPGVLFAIDPLGFLDTSTDAGVHWREWSHGDAPSALMAPLVVDPRFEDTLYAGGGWGLPDGVAVTLDGGATWSSLGSVRTDQLVFDPTGALLRAGDSFSSGVWRLVLPSAPVAPARPTVVGDPTVGASIVCDPGTWSAGVTVAFGWRRDDQPIPGVTTDHLTLTDDDAGHSIRCAVTGTTDLGSIITLSPPVSVLAAPAGGDGATAVPAPSAPSVATPPGAPASVQPVDAPAVPTSPAIAVLASTALAPAAQQGVGPQTTPARGARLLLSRPVRLRARGRLPFAVACSSARGCVGSLTLRARAARAHAPGVRVGSVAFRLGPQSRGTITLTLTAAGRRLFGSQRRRTLLVTLTERARDQSLPPVTRAVVVVDA